MFSDSSEKELYEIIDKFWSEYKKFINKNDVFGGNEFIRSSIDIIDVYSHM